MSHDEMIATLTLLGWSPVRDADENHERLVMSTYDLIRNKGGGRVYHCYRNQQQVKIGEGDAAASSVWYLPCKWSEFPPDELPAMFTAIINHDT